MAQSLVGDKFLMVYPLQSILKPTPFSIFIKNQNDGPQGSLSKFVDDVKLGKLVDKPKGRAAIQRNVGRLEKWADGICLKFIKEKYKILTLQRNPTHQYRLSSNQMKIFSTEEENLTAED